MANLLPPDELGPATPEHHPCLRGGCGIQPFGWSPILRGRVTVLDLGDAVVLLPPGGRQRLLASALSADDHLLFVDGLEDPDVATA